MKKTNHVNFESLILFFLNQSLWIFITTGLFCLFLPHLAYSEKFTTSYINFDIPDGWACHHDENYDVNFICSNKKSKRLSQGAFIILTAKEKSSQDNLENYISYLKKKKGYKTQKNESITSKVLHAKKKNIKKHFWADGFHLESEVPNYYTRYLGSTKGGLAVLVTYTAKKDLWKKYARDFSKSILSLRLTNVNEGLKRIKALNKRRAGRGKTIQDYISEIVGDGEISDEDQGSKLSQLFNKYLPELIGGSLISTILGILAFRMARKRSQGSSSFSSSRKSKSSSLRRRRRRK